MFSKRSPFIALGGYHKRLNTKTPASHEGVRLIGQSDGNRSSRPAHVCAIELKKSISNMTSREELMVLEDCFPAYIANIKIQSPRRARYSSSFKTTDQHKDIMKPSRRCCFRRKMRWACLIRPVIGYLVCLSVFTLLYAPRLRKQAFWRHYSPQWDNWAIALKSGHQVAFDRVPIVLETYLGSVRNMMLIGETSNVTINGARMVGVDVTLASLQSTCRHFRT